MKLKFLAYFAGLAMLVGSTFVAIPQVSANDHSQLGNNYRYENNDWKNNHNWQKNRDQYDRDYHKWQERQRSFQRETRVNYNCGCNKNQNQWQKMWWQKYNQNRDKNCRTVYPKTMQIYDRNDHRNYLNMNNSYRDNRDRDHVRVGVSHEIFMKIVNNVEINNVYNIDVNTGNNTIKLNTVVGDITTGDINIEIN